ncbi:MAG: cyclase family protein, partial [Chloroflexota bacterium]
MTSPQRFRDVSVRLHAGMPTFPGDPGVEIDLALSLAKGDGANVTRACFGIHSGTHVDAPYHVDPAWPRFSDAYLSTLIGPVRVVELTSPVAITAADLEPWAWIGVERVLFKTRNSGLWADDRFHEDFVHLAEDGARFLVERTGVRMVGIDYLSIERLH